MPSLRSEAEPFDPLPHGTGAAPVAMAQRAPAPMDIAGWFALQKHDPQSAREWALAMRKPVEYTLENLRQRPRRAAELLAPVMDVALVEHRRHRALRWRETAWKCMAVITNPSLWPLSIHALWEGEPVWEYMERKAGWYQVVEAVLVASGTHTLLGRAESKWRRHGEGEQPLQNLLRVPVESQFDHGRDTQETPAIADEDGSHVMVLVGVYCRLAVRVYGHAPAKLQPDLQCLCQEADRMLERASLDQPTRSAMIDRLIQRALMKNSPASSPWTLQSAIMLGIIGSLILLAIATFYGKQERLWQDAVRALSEEPGLQVVGESTSWGKREIRGLRDPLARNPEEVLNNLGIDTSNITLKFKAYLSAEEPFLLKHITSGPRQVIAVSPAPTATAEVRTEPPPQIAVPRRVASQQTMVREADTSKETLGSIESITILFQSGKAELASGHVEKLAALTRQVRQLQELAASNSQVLRVSMSIHQASNPTRASLWQLRQLSVRNALEQVGVAPQSIDPVLITSAVDVPDANAPDTLSLRLSFESSTDQP